MSARGSNLSATFDDFARANYLRRYPLDGFPKSLSVKVEEQLPTVEHPVHGQQPKGQSAVGPLGAHYLVFTDGDLVAQPGFDPSKGVTLNVHFGFDPFPGGSAAAKLYLVPKGGGDPVEGPEVIHGQEVDFQAAGFGRDYGQVVVAISNSAWGPVDLVRQYYRGFQYSYRAEIASLSVSVSPDKSGIYNKGERATFTVSVLDAFLQPFDPRKLVATLASPSGTQYVDLVQQATGVYTYTVPSVVPGTYTLAAKATQGYDDVVAQASITVERILWLSDGNLPGYYSPGLSFRWFVIYHQRDNVPPQYVRVQVRACTSLGCQPDQFFDMQQDNPGDATYADGAFFIYDMPTDPTGQTTYAYLFHASDGAYTVRGMDPVITPPGTGTPDSASDEPGLKSIGPKSKPKPSR